MCSKVVSSIGKMNLNVYDLIAIDMDNTLLQYNLMNDMSMTHTLIQKFMVEKYNYPKDICQQFCPKYCQKGLVIDKKRGNILKLDSNFGIMSAKHGFNDICQKSVQTLYDSHCREQLKQIPDLLNAGTLATTVGFEFYVLRDYFSSPSAQVFAKTVEVIDKQSAGTSNTGPNYEQIWRHVLDTMIFIYGHNDLTAPAGQQLFANPEKYYRKTSPKVIKMLRDLRSNGKLIFLVTSSNADAVKFVMNYAFGDQWISCFDLVLTFARKPTFFATDRKFLSIDCNNQIAGEVDVNDLKCGQIYCEGNWNGLKTFAAKQCGRSDPKCVYIGDSFNDDCIVPNRYVGCDSIGIVEELEETTRPELDPTYWQSFLGNSQTGTTLWYHLLQKHTKLLVPNIDALVDHYF